MVQQVGRRFFIALGIGRYCHLPADEQLRHVPADVRAMRDLFEGFGYRSVLPGLGEYDGAEQIRQKLRHWSTDARLTQDDVVVVYFAGHGLVQDRDRHYLLCWDSQDEDAATTALATEDLIRILCRGDLRHLLLVLDTCSGGAGSAEAAAVALQSIAYRHGGAGTSTGLWFLASARRKDVAEDGVFVSALRTAVDITTGRTGQRQEYLDLTELVKAVNEGFEAEGRGQRTELASGLVTGLAPFLPNSGFREGLPPVGTDLEIQRRVAERDLTEHFGPRSRGVEFESEHGLYFSGRVRVLSELVEWLTAEVGDGRGRVITGSPGCGKSAVLGRIVALSDELYRTKFDLPSVDPATVVPEGCVQAAVHARHKRLDEVVERIATDLGTEADGTAALLQELTRRGRQGPPVVIVVDAVDEAGSDTAADAGGHGEPRRITRELLRPMSEIHGVRLLVGTRHELVTPLGPTFTCIDLDLPGYRAEHRDVTEYVTRMLLASEEPDVRTPYRDQPVLAETVAAAVATRAVGVYLYARTTSRTLRSDSAVVDVSRPRWADELPSEVGEAFDDYLARFGPDEPRVRRMLLALAFSEGKGLPRGRVWTTLSSVISGTACVEEDVSWVLDVAEAYVAEVIDDDRRSAYRLYHKALAEHLRKTADRKTTDIQRSVVEALISVVPVVPGGRPDWFAAPPYVRQYLATHAGASGMLAGLIEDPGFLLACEPLGLLRALASIEGDAARRIRTAYEQVAHRLTPDRPVGARAADLQLSARRCEANELADRVENLGVALPWTARWAWWSASGAHRLLSGHTRGVDCVAIGDLDERPIAVTGSVDKTVRVWDLTTQRQIGDPLSMGVAVSAVAIGDLGDYTVALTGGVDGMVRVWDLSAGQEYGRPLTGHTNRIEAIRIGAIGDRPVVLTASSDGTARVWDLVRREQLGCDLAAHRRTVRDAALGEFKGRPVAVTGGDDKAVHVWDLGDLLDGGDARIDGSPLIGPAEAVTALCVSPLDGSTAVLVGDKSGMLSLWDLATRRQIGEPVVAHRYFERSGVASATIGRFGGRTVAVTCGRLETRLWDLRSLHQLGPPLRGHVDDIQAAAVTSRGDASIAVTVSDDRTARIWDLSAVQPEEGHSGQVHCVAMRDVRGLPFAMTGGEDGTARLWDLRKRGQASHSMEGHHGSVLAVAFGTVRRRCVAVTGGVDTTVRLWDPFRGESLGPPLTGHTNAVRCVALGVLGGESVVVSGSDDGTVRIWDAVSGELAHTPLSGHIGGIRHLAVRRTGGGMEIAIATSLDHAYHWRMTGHATSAPDAHFDLEDLTPNAQALGVAFHGDRPVALSTREGNGVYVHDIVTRTAVGRPLVGHTNGVLAGTLARVGGITLVASVAFDDTVRVWDLEKSEPIGAPLEGMSSLLRVGSEPCPAPALGQADGSPVAVTAFTREVRVWDLNTMRPVGEPLCGVDHSLVSASIVPALGRGAAVVTGSVDGSIRAHDLDDGRQIAPHIPTTEVTLFHAASARLGDDTVVVTSSWKEANVWSLEPHGRLGKRFGTSWGASLHTMDGNAFAVTVAGDFALHAWQLRTQAPVCPPMYGHTAMVRALRVGLLGSSHLLATASLDGTVRLWDLRTGEPFIDPIEGHGRGAFSVEFVHLQRDLLVSGAGDGRLRFWDMAARCDAGIELEPFPSAVRAMRSTNIRGVPILIAGDGYGLTRVWDTRFAGWTAELDVGGGIRELAVDDEGRVCLATDMGAVVLGINVAETPRNHGGAAS
ncbi:caspase family protein [Streptomyces sp. NBC_00243]|uniref:caspase family protein n=1 Tax=Streptomyces sp. NBC_00243 TaxID=2975688 RepID=UPI002DDAE5AB|nr:caspase family protein [Streptomyces sp. NBC_00243]WRZ19027.1 caspase family protein [Streptomyces sp. NBC_00243]